MPFGLSYYSSLNKFAKALLNPLHGAGVAVLRGVGVIDFPVPLNSSMRKTSSTNVMHYHASGIRSYLPIATMAEREGLNLRRGGLTILDFGCGVGRQLLHFTRAYPANDYYACDIDDTAVAFIKSAYPQVASHVNRFNPPLRFDAGTFDLVYSVSIFSHLNMEDVSAWLRELARVIKPGGYLCLTTEGPTAMKSLCRVFDMNEEIALGTLVRNGFLFKEYDNWKEAAARTNTLRVASGLVGVENSYGNAAVSPGYVRTAWNVQGLRVVDVIEGIIDNRQDLVVLKREAASFQGTPHT